MGGCFSDVRGGKAALGGRGGGVHNLQHQRGQTTNEDVKFFYPNIERMGGCLSDVHRGKAAVGGRGGGVHNLQHQRGPTTNEAVEFFYPNIELSLSASNLPDLSKSGPMAVVYAEKQDETLVEVGRTEVILNNSDPLWITKINVAFHFEILQPLVLRVYDVDHNTSTEMLDLNEQDYVGEAKCVLSVIMTHQSQSMTRELQYRNRVGVGLGSITVHAKETIASKMAIEMRLRCSNLGNKNRFSKSVLTLTERLLKQDPFLRISRVVEEGSPIPICKTEVVNKNLDPVWKPFYITMHQYVSKDSPLVIECFDFNSNSNGNHTLIGKLHTSIQDLENLYRADVGANFVFPSSRQKDHDMVLNGKLFVDGYKEKEINSFLDYISSGVKLNFMVAVDFTASNGDPKLPHSLHYIGNSSVSNAYQQAITDVGEVIQVYDDDDDKRSPAWGFGGKIQGSVSHCFNLNGSGSGSFEVKGVSGIINAYKNALDTVPLYGPTLLGHVINQAAVVAEQPSSTNSNKYFVLLIITDNVCTDLQATKDALVKASVLPLSVLIVGVGSGDFKQMEILDADTGPCLESSTGKVATRDIVQFIHIPEVQEDGMRSTVQSLLEKLPGQFLTYMRTEV